MKFYLSNQVLAAKKHYKQATKKASVNDIYKLRVAVRRIRMILQLLKTNKTATLKARELKTINKTWKTLGKLRDLDVAIESAEAFNLDTTKLKRQRKNTYPQTLAKIKAAKFNQVIKSVDKLSKSITEENLKPFFMTQKLLSDLDRKFQSISDLHDLRIILKKTRYLMESLGLPVTQFKVYQNVLGELNDLENLLHLFKGNKAVTAARKRKLALARKIMKPAQALAVKKLKHLQR